MFMLQQSNITNNRINAATMVHLVGEPQRTAPENSRASICTEDLLIHLLKRLLFLGYKLLTTHKLAHSSFDLSGYI